MTKNSIINKDSWKNGLLKVRKGAQLLGNKLSGMIMPIIGVILAWGLATAFFIPSGWTPVHVIDKYFVGSAVNYLIPTLIGFMGGYNVYNKRGGFIGAFAAFALACAATAYEGNDLYSKINILGKNEKGEFIRGLGPQFLGAMIVGPLSAVFLKKTELVWEGKIKAGFEMLVNNFYFAFAALVVGAFSFFVMVFPIMAINYVFGQIIDGLTRSKAMPVTSLFVEPAKPLFLNNAINHGVFTPIGLQQANEHGKSLLFYIESNPGPGAGMLLGIIAFDKDRKNRAQAMAAAPVQFFGGIHEVYFPFILMRPLLILAPLAGGVAGVAALQIFNAGATGPASPGSIIALYAVSAHGAMDYAGLSVAIFGSLGVSFIVSSLIIKFVYNRKKAHGVSLDAAIAKMNAIKGSDSKYIKVGANGKTIETTVAEENLNNSSLEDIVKRAKKIVFACDAGMGSSAMGASILRKKTKDFKIADLTITNSSLSTVPKDADIIVTQKTLLDRAKKQNPNTFIYPIGQFLTETEYDKLLMELQKRKS